MTDSRRDEHDAARPAAAAVVRTDAELDGVRHGTSAHLYAGDRAVYDLGRADREAELYPRVIDLAKCETCDGSGEAWRPGTGFHRCTACGGNGWAGGVIG